ncbi:hypothetical protein TPY_1029 [Sulfobacillus acidophilus TPY]|uniref:Cupin 2 conserved barrel domain protein n=1 Tax=Sulfobacillus acidophilus (strain ATCC 700253 / DSM 10332 / NAL) TaxID=679936 RepID=G8TX79_SULAD|nr:hypothetical protein TPY_1029 [Sulfobacillus acidophilus TPY]AEW06081.1 Cupin 2 conserved barrel domain protein [Sulfobacillus acidophilus DSM 10332]
MKERWSIEDPALFHPDHITVTHRYDAPHAAVVWFGLKAGQALKEHETSSQVMIQVLTGAIWMTAGTESFFLRAGETVVLQAGVRHGFTAEDDALVQLIIVPHPRYHSLKEDLGLS